MQPLFGGGLRQPKVHASYSDQILLVGHTGETIMFEQFRSFAVAHPILAAWITLLILLYVAVLGRYLLGNRSKPRQLPDPRPLGKKLEKPVNPPDPTSAPESIPGSPPVAAPFPLPVPVPAEPSVPPAQAPNSAPGGGAFPDAKPQSSGSETETGSLPEEVGIESHDLQPLEHQSSEGGYITVTLHYGTDRNDLGPHADVNNRYGEKRAAASPGFSPVTYGTCDVAIPRTHAVGKLEEPNWGRAEVPDKHVMILSLDSQSPDEFFATIGERLAGLRQCFIFVHGFNVSFRNAARRTAQIAYDLRFDGVPIFYSWPTAVVGESSLSPTTYTEAENNAIWSHYHFADFLLDVIRRAKPEVLHIVAHSMGNRVVSDALVDIGPLLTAEERSILREVLLTAPDIDAQTFKEHIAPRLVGVVPRVSLYASDNDTALGLSQSLHKNPRIGLTRAAVPMPVPGVEVIDASDANTDYFGHNYFGDAESILADFFLATRTGLSAGERRQTLDFVGGTHWDVREDATIEAAWESLQQA